MNRLAAARHAHDLWRKDGPGWAGYINGMYEVGVGVERDKVTVYGRSPIGFEDAFANAQGETPPGDPGMADDLGEFTDHIDRRFGMVQ